MKKYIFLWLLMLTALMVAAQEPLISSQITRQKDIDNGGSGVWKAKAVSERSLPDFVVYRPKDLKGAAAQEGKLPVLVFGNGGCSDTSAGYERMLIEVASQGYVVVAIGEMQLVYGDRKDKQTPSSMLAEAMNWMCQQVKNRKSDYYNCVDTTRMAAAGHSCGGAQVLFNSADPRLRTYIILNAGMGDMEMAGASRQSLDGLHGPILYLTGGPSDVAYPNAGLDYERIQHVPVAYGDMPAAGHGGTYGDKGGGDFGRMLLAWLDWQLKGKDAQKDVFLHGNLNAYPGWTMKQKNFGDLWIESRPGRKIYGIISDVDQQQGGKHGVAIISHGFNGTYHFGRDYFKTLADLGYATYTFDYPCGSVNSRSDNNTLNMSILDQKADLKSIVNYFRQQPDVDPNRIVLIGESQGGLISALAAADLKKQVQALVLIYPALCIPENWRKHYPDVSAIPDTTNLWNVPMGKRFFQEIHDMDAYSLIKHYTGPVLIVQGDKDPIVDVSYSVMANKTYKNAQLKIIPGAGHGFKPEEREISNQHVKEFLQK